MKEISIETTEQLASHRDVLVRRSLDCDGLRIIGTIEIQTISRTPTVVELTDEFPTGLPVKQVEFLPDAEPDQGEITAQHAAITHRIADTSTIIEYAIELSEPLDEVSFTSPRIENVHPHGELEPADGQHDSEGHRQSGSDETDSTPAMATATATKTDGVEQGSEETAKRRPDTSAGSDRTTVATEKGGESDAATLLTPAVQQVQSSRRNDETDPLTTQTAATQSSKAEGEETEDLTVIPVDSTRQEGPPTSNPAREESEQQSREEEEPREEQQGRGSQQEGESPAVEARLDHLSARVEEFAAYASVLEDVLNEQAESSGLIPQIEDEVEVLDTRLETIRTELQTLGAVHDDAISEVRKRTDRLETRLDDMRNSYETELNEIQAHVDGEVARFEDAVDAHVAEIDGLNNRVAAIETDVTELRNTVETVNAEVTAMSNTMAEMQEEFEALRGEVSALADLRESLANVFETTNEPQQSGED